MRRPPPAHVLRQVNMRAGRVGNYLLRALLLFSLALAAFSYGMATAHYRLFPYRTLCEANQAWQALKEVCATGQARAGAGADAVPGDLLGTEPAARRLADDAGEEWLLVSGGPDYLRSRGFEAGCLAWLMDRRGDIQHVWRYNPGVWRDLQHVYRLPGFSTIYPVDVHLCDDGGLLVSFQGENCFPFAVGLARFDWDSRLLWKRELVHHWFSVDQNGRIYAPSLRVVDSPMRLRGIRPPIASPRGKILSDTIVILSPQGDLLEEIELAPLLVDSGCVGLFHGVMADGANPLADAITDDPIHLNDVRVVEDLGQGQPAWLAPGDLLVSMRSINALAILDGRTRRVKWLAAGWTLRQHSPRLVQGGAVVFDNLGGGQEPAGSRIVRLDFGRQVPQTLFPLPSQPLPTPFFTETAGHLDIHPQGRRALVALAHQGRIWEIELAGGHLLWEYVLGEGGRNGRPKPLYTAKYVKPFFQPSPKGRRSAP